MLQPSTVSKKKCEPSDRGVDGGKQRLFQADNVCHVHCKILKFNNYFTKINYNLVINFDENVNY